MLPELGFANCTFGSSPMVLQTNKVLKEFKAQLSTYIIDISWAVLFKGKAILKCRQGRIEEEVVACFWLTGIHSGALMLVECDRLKRNSCPTEFHPRHNAWSVTRKGDLVIRGICEQLGDYQLTINSES